MPCMTISVATNEPTEIRIGDTWQWRREDLDDAPAPTWVLTYYFRNLTNHFNVVAAADGAHHAITVAKATTAALIAGGYEWVAVVTSATERYQVGSGRMTLLPDFSAASALDARTFARKLLDSVEAALLNRATTDQLDVINATIADRGIQRGEGALIKLRSQLIAEVKREENAEAMRQGRPSKNRVMVRFARG